MSRTAFLDGRSRRPISDMYAIPATTTAAPTGVKSNMEKGPYPCSSSAALIRMFGGVPIRVIKPPSSELKASGIRSREGARPVRRAMSMTTGSSNAATPTLFMNAERPAAVSMITMTSRPSLSPESLSTWRPRIPATPVRESPPLKMNTAQTVITAGLLKPDTAWLGSRSPVTARVTSTMSATMSTRTRSVTNRMTATTRMPRTRPMSGVNRCCAPLAIDYTHAA